MTDNLPAQLSQIHTAIVTAESVEEHDWIDKKLAELKEMGSREDASKNQMDEIAEARIDNFQAMGDKLDDLRENGIIKHGGDKSKVSNGELALPSRKRRQLADELNDWPEDSHQDYGEGCREFIKIHKQNETKELTVTGAYGAAKEYRLRRERLIAEVEGFEHPDVMLFNADFRDVLPRLDPEIASMIFTDPPYANEFKHLYSDLADLSRSVVAEGGSLLAYIGHFAAPDIFRYFSQFKDDWRFWWLIAIDQRHHGGRRILDGKDVRVHWKPIIWYVRGGRFNTEYVDDMIDSKAPAKELHEWEQSPIEAEYYIEYLSEPGGWVLDPMMGSGTTGIAALNKGRKFIGIEIDEHRYNIATRRLKEWLKSAKTTEPNQP